jgi:hypothetical protein
MGSHELQQHQAFPIVCIVQSSTAGVFSFLRATSYQTEINIKYLMSFLSCARGPNILRYGCNSKVQKVDSQPKNIRSTSIARLSPMAFRQVMCSRGRHDQQSVQPQVRLNSGIDLCDSR